MSAEGRGSDWPGFGRVPYRCLSLLGVSVERAPDVHIRIEVNVSKVNLCASLLPRIIFCSVYYNG